MRTSYAAMKSDGGGEGNYDAWFARDINNAQLAATAAYREYLPAFQQLMQQAAGDFGRFYSLAAEIGRLPAEARSQRLRAIMVAASGLI